MQLPVRVGVIGAGVIGERHARIYSELAGCELVGVYDPDTVRAADVVQRHGGSSFRLLEQLLAEVDAVSIVSPTVTHATTAHRAFDFGRHVLIEEPMTATVGEARLLAERVKRAERVVIAGHSERFNPVVRKLRRIIAGDRPRRVRLRRIEPLDSRRLDSDVVNDLMIRDIDLVHGLFGTDVIALAARGAIVRTDRIDQAIVDLSLRRGPLVSIIASRVGETRVREIEVAVEGACIVADLLDRSISVTRALDPIGRSVTDRINVMAADPLRLEIQHFLACILGAERPLIDANAGLRNVELSDRIWKLIDQPVVSHQPGVTAGG